MERPFKLMAAEVDNSKCGVESLREQEVSNLERTQISICLVALLQMKMKLSIDP